jgi:16S rRNA (cytidine1402-2'-O)-methyltransferase
LDVVSVDHDGRNRWIAFGVLEHAATLREIVLRVVQHVGRAVGVVVSDSGAAIRASGRDEEIDLRSWCNALDVEFRGHALSFAEDAAMPLVLVPTPLGNLRDVTLRALDVLRDAELIVAEDTRVARRLLQALGIAGRELWSYREQNAAGVTHGIVERARTGLVAMTCDAGMPGISDPGSDLVTAARGAGVPVDVLPGASAAFGVAALSGFSLRRFTFEGFPPRAGGARRAAFAAALRENVTTIWYESPRRIRGTLADLAEVAPDVRVFLVREYTKRHEQQALGSPAEVAAALIAPVRGEVAFAIAPYRRPGAAGADTPLAGDADEAIDALLVQNHRIGEIAKMLARRGLGNRADLYARASARRAAGKGRAISTETGPL